MAKMTRKQWRQMARHAQRVAQEGRVVEAIRFLRMQTNCGLKEAFDAVIELRRMPEIKVGY